MFQTIISIVFFFTFMIYISLGIYSVTRNINKKINRLFLLTCLSVAIWTYAYAMVNALYDYDQVLLWIRVSAIGWGFTFSFSLHFVLELTETKIKIKTHFLLLLIYIPALVNITVFSLFSTIANNQYNYG